MFNATKSPGESCQTNENIALGRTTILFGGDLDANLPYGSKLRMTAEYLPKVTDWENNYVIRGLADWTMPIIGWLDFKLSIINTYNNQAAEDTQRNSFTSTLGLSFRF